MWDTIYKIIQDVGPGIGIFSVVVLVGAGLEWWVWGYVHRREIARLVAEKAQVIRDKEYWRAKTFVALGIGEEISQVASDLVEEDPA